MGWGGGLPLDGAEPAAIVAGLVPTAAPVVELVKHLAIELEGAVLEVERELDQAALVDAHAAQVQRQLLPLRTPKRHRRHRRHTAQRWIRRRTTCEERGTRHAYRRYGSSVDRISLADGVRFWPPPLPPPPLPLSSRAPAPPSAAADDDANNDDGDEDVGTANAAAEATP